jgi:prevent-host-death family protein
MSVPDQMPLAEVKNRRSEVVDRLEREDGHVIITKHGRPAAVVISVEDLSAESRRQLPVHILDSLGGCRAALGAGPLNACRDQVTEFGGGVGVPLIAGRAGAS